MTHVVDSSVVLAYVLDEPGGTTLTEPHCCFHLSMVNLAEVFTKVVERGGAVEDVQETMAKLPIRIRTFREVHAIDVAALRMATRHLGLSFGDRACLALGRGLKLPVLTADRKWHDLELGIDIRLIR
jgi:PIN domain nuclease of toxin-antitoxin system